VQCYRLDWHGRRLLCGYGFAHLPLQPGPHRLEINVWRPVGSPDQELDAYLLGRTPSLVSHEPIYESAWKERSRMVTVSGGKVLVDLMVITRHLDKQGIDEARIS
jgi:B9 domain-containing protein 2